ncbi:MAG: hypothetical protein IKF90_01175, partial [Parasporobacterium sp.]|nr:hypothetical protein [Parasporobacterium sp.]
DQLADKAKSIKGAKHALGHNPENCTECQTDKIKLIENNYPDLYRAYQCFLQALFAKSCKPFLQKVAIAFCI